MARNLKRSEDGKTDSAWLKNLVNNPNVSVVDNDSGQEVDTNELEAIIKNDEDTPDNTTTQKKTEDLSKRVEDQKTKDAQSEERKKLVEQKQKEREEKQKLAEQKRSADEAARKMNAAKSASQRILSSVNDKLDVPIQKVGQSLDVIQAAKTPGGIGFLLLLLIFLLWVVVRVNQKGETRIKQLWYMLNGKANIEPPPNIATGEFASPTGTANIASGDISNFSSSSSSTGSNQDTAAMVIDYVSPYLSSNSFRVGSPI